MLPHAEFERNDHREYALHFILLAEVADRHFFNEEILTKEITGILRRRYLYCVYCGFSYNDEKDLEENCPGNSYQLHD